MSCCGGNCSCGKGNQSPAQENIHLVQMSTTQGMLSTQDWMKGLGNLTLKEEVVEVRFKNNRKVFYRNPHGLNLSKDDRVVVEVEGGHDVGTVSLTGSLAEKQFEQKESNKEKSSLKKIYRKSTQVDIDKWLESKKREREVMIEARRMASSLDLGMSINDIEFQGDGRKLTVYYTAESRVDFRELIRKYASAFRAKIEMKQIGVRQGAAKVGGIGSCGRELCCSTWKTEMNSVKTEAARTQNLSLTTSKLAGQCGKLKCCLNYELDTYLEAWDQFPKELIELETDHGTLTPLQPDVLKGIVYYLHSGPDQKRYIIPIEKVKMYVSLNKKGKQIETARIDSGKTSTDTVHNLHN